MGWISATTHVNLNSCNINKLYGISNTLILCIIHCTYHISEYTVEYGFLYSITLVVAAGHKEVGLIVGDIVFLVFDTIGVGVTFGFTNFVVASTVGEIWAELATPFSGNC